MDLYRISKIGRTAIAMILLGFMISCGQWYVDRYLHNNLEIPNLWIASAEEALNWVYFNIKYEVDDKDYWQTPEYTYVFRTGDCEDMAILWMYLVEKQANITGTKLLIVQPTWSTNLHAIGWSNNWYYDCTQGIRLTYNQLVTYYAIVKEYNYDEATDEAYRKQLIVENNDG